MKTGTTGTQGTLGTTGTRALPAGKRDLVPVVPSVPCVPVVPGLTSEDWRELAAEEAAPLLAAEADAYRRELCWDVRPAWAPVEPARLSRALPGYVVRDGGGTIRGWTCFLDHHGVRQVAMLVSDTPLATAALVERIVTAPGAVGLRGEIVCVRDAAPGLADALRARRFDVSVYRYLSLSAFANRSGGPPIPRRDRAWRPDDLEAVVALCARAYADSTDVRAFAPAGTSAEWLDYITTMVSGTGCGTFMPDASFLVEGDDGGTLDAAVLTTDLGCGTAHIAQVVVDPVARGRGLGRRLVDAVIGHARGHGCARVTLLVADTNRAAGRLYDAAGFLDRAQHIVAVRMRGLEKRVVLGF